MPHVACLGDTTVTGDPIVGPGAPNVLIGGRPVARVGDAVTGLTCSGTITTGSATVRVGGVPVARVGDLVVGTNPQTGSPVTTSIGVGSPNVVVGG